MMVGSLAEEQNRAVYGYIRMLRINTHKRRPLITNSGYLALGRLDSQPGDLLVIFLGAQVPFVVREIQNGIYRLIGEAYVHGVMDGQFIEESLSIETFEPR